MGLSHATRVTKEIGEDGTEIHQLQDLEILLSLFKKDFPSLELKAPEKLLAERHARLDAGKEKAFKVRSIKLDELDDCLKRIDIDDQTVKEILLWLGINKVQNFYLEVCPNIDAKLFTKESDGSWKVAKSPQGSRLTPFDTLLEVNGHRVKGLTSEQLTKLVKDSKGCPNVRVHRKTRSKKQMYEALRLPPPTTKITLWDMDLCLLRVHTGGHTNEKLQHLSKQVTEAYVYLMDIMIAKGYKTGVVTFSDKLVAKSVGVPYGGEELVRPLVFHALRRHWMAQDRTLKLADAIARARNYVENELYVRAAYPEWRNNNVEEWKRTPMPNSKEWHVTRIKEDFEAKTKQKIQNKEVVLFDDGKRNIEEAVKSGVVAVLVNEEIGFTVKDWEEAMDTAWTQHLKSNSKA